MILIDPTGKASLRNIFFEIIFHQEVTLFYYSSVEDS